METALIKLVEQGLPMAASAIKWYYLYWSFCAFSISATLLALGGMAYHLVKRWQDFKFNRYKG